MLTLLEKESLMANPDKSIDPKILLCAKTEFQQHGFAKASLREICDNAGVTTGAFYNRYKNKDELFYALVEDAILAIEEKLVLMDRIAATGNGIEDWFFSAVSSEEHLPTIIDFLYEKYDSFRLLLCCSNGSKYENFLHCLTERNTQIMLNYIQTQDKWTLRVDEEELHLLCTTFWSSIFETIQHEFPKEKAKNYCKVLARFFHWEAILKTN